MDRVYQVMVTDIRGETKEIDLCHTEEQWKKMTVLQLREKIGQRYPDSDERKVRLFANGRVLVKDKLLSDYGVNHMSVIQMFAILRGGGCPVGEGDGGMGDKKDKNRSMEKLSLF